MPVGVPGPDETESRVTLEAHPTLVREFQCAWCYEWFRSALRSKRYCCNAHRQKAYRKRKKETVTEKYESP